MAKVEIPLTKNGKQTGRVVYDLKSRKYGFGEVILVEHESAGMKRKIRAALRGNPLELLVKSHLVDEIAETIDGLTAVLHTIADRNPSFDYDVEILSKNQPTFDSSDDFTP